MGFRLIDQIACLNAFFLLKCEECIIPIKWGFCFILILRLNVALDCNELVQNFK